MILGVYLPLILGLFSCIIFAISWRGRKLSGVIHCKRCLYDLSGNPDTTQCPECGAALNQPHQTTTTTRRRRKWLVYPSGVISILFLGWFAYVTVFYFQFKFNKYEYYPDSWLIRAVEKQPEIERMSLCWQEIGDRLFSSKLNAKTSHRLVKLILKMHQNPEMPWNRRILGGCLFLIHDQGNMSEQDVAQYQQQLIDQIKLLTRNAVRQQDQLPVRLDLSQVRDGERFDLSISCVEIQGVTKSDPQGNESEVLLDSDANSGSSEVTIAYAWGTPLGSSGWWERFENWCILQRLWARIWYHRDSIFNYYKNEVVEGVVTAGMGVRDPVDTIYTFPHLTQALPAGSYQTQCDVAIESCLGPFKHTYLFNVNVVDQYQQTEVQTLWDESWEKYIYTYLQFHFMRDADGHVKLFSSPRVDRLMMPFCIVTKVYIELDGKQYPIGTWDYLENDQIDVRLFTPNVQVTENVNKLKLVLTPAPSRAMQMSIYDAIWGKPLSFEASRTDSMVRKPIETGTKIKVKPTRDHDPGSVRD